NSFNGVENSKQSLETRRADGQEAKEWHLGCQGRTIGGIVGLASSRTVEVVAPKSSLTPCILDDDPAQLEMLSAVSADIAAGSVGFHAEAYRPHAAEEVAG